MASVLRRWLAATAVAGLCTLSANAQSSPGVSRVSGGMNAAPITPPPLTGVLPAAAESPVKDLTPNILPGLFESPGAGGAAGHAEPGHGDAGHGADAHGGNGHGGGGHGDHHAGPGFYGHAEYLLLRPRRGAFDYAIVDSSKNLAPNGALETLNYELRSGARAGVGYRFKDTAWSAGFTYTYLRSSSDDTLTADPNGLIYPTLSRPGLVDNVGTATATASLEYNVFDVEISRQVHVDDRLNLRLYGGVRFSTIRQDFDAMYDLRDANRARVATQSNFDGFGPLLGAEASLKTFGNFHLFGKTSAAMLTGTVTNPYQETNNGGLTTFADVTYRTRRVLPVFGSGIGLGWERRGVAVRVGYEMTNWFNLIDQIRFTNDLAEGKLTTRQTDLSMEGLFVQFAVQY
jgi:Legionella pneumophila major outer membrane protein precursor